uniref:Uncharacterized protein n=1 Tax=Pyrodinium bahamense TaxID=73915 RepID=A0A7S0FLH7_9DINO
MEVLAGAAEPIIEGTAGRAMTTAAFQAAKKAHRRDPVNNPDPADLIGLRKNMGYDSDASGKRSAWRPRPASADDGREDVLDRVIGHLPDGSPVTLRSFEAAERFAHEKPDAPRPPELDLEGSRFSRSVEDGEIRTRTAQSKAGSGSATFCNPGFRPKVQQNAGYKAGLPSATISLPSIRQPSGTLASAGLLFVCCISVVARLSWQQHCRLRAGRDRHLRSSLHVMPKLNTVTLGRCHLYTEPADCAKAVLLDFQNATHRFFGLPEEQRETILQDLLGIVARHELHDTVGIDMKHKHFDLSPGCVLFEVQEPGAKQSTMKPTKPDIPMTPFSFLYVDGCWVPHEFVQEECTSAADGLERLRSKPEFLIELSLALAKWGLQDVLGIHILHREHLAGETHGTVETPGSMDDELLVRPYTEDLYHKLCREESYQVMWTWDKSSGGVCIVHCANCPRPTCNNHCIKHK